VYDAIVLAGGSARRLQGADKPGLDLGGTSLLEHVLAATHHAVATIVVGPERATSREVIWCREQPVGGGPVAALAAGLEPVRSPVVLVLAADLPAIAPAVPALISALDQQPVDVVALNDAEGRDNYLAAAWHADALRAALARIGDPVNVAMRRVVEQVALGRLIDTYGWGRDCDTWDELARARRETEDGSRT
jgi:molybdopterin-guanine dinucleotide biosynthesis protein A